MIGSALFISVTHNNPEADKYVDYTELSLTVKVSKGVPLTLLTLKKFIRSEILQF